MIVPVVILVFALSGSSAFHHKRHHVAQEGNCGRDFTIASAYFRERTDSKCVDLFFSTSHILWKSDSPYTGFNEVVCSVEGIRGSHLVSRTHESKCNICFSGSRSSMQNSSITVDLYLNSSIVCSVPSYRLSPPVSPKFNLVGVTEVRNPVRLKEWVDYHLDGSGFDHIFIYDDNSTVDIRVGLDLNRVTVVDWSHVARSPGRQFMAIQDFVYRFAPLSKWVLQFDDDCFFKREGLHELLNGSSVAQISIPSAFYGSCSLQDQFVHPTTQFLACDNSSLCFIESTDAPMVCALTGRSSAPKEMFSWKNSANQTMELLGTLSFARSSRISMSSGITHYFRVDGETVVVDPSVYSFAHYKTVPWKEHERKSASGAWGSIVGDKHFWQKLNHKLCQESFPYDPEFCRKTRTRKDH